MRTPILKPGPPPSPPPPPTKKKKTPFQCHSWLQIILWKNTAVISNLAPPAWNSITRNDANDSMFYLFGDTLRFTMLSLFSSAILLSRSNAINLHNACNILWTRRPGTNWNCWLRWRRIFASLNYFRICAKTPKINEWIELLQKLKENSLRKLFKILEETQQMFNRDRKHETRVEILMTDEFCHWWTWTGFDVHVHVQCWTNVLSWFISPSAS